jgi:hypothetical protein
MRRFLVSLILAGAVTTPAFADIGDRHSHDGSRVERSESRDSHQDRSSDRSQARSESRAQVSAARSQGNPDRQQRPNGFANSGNRDRAAAQGNVEVQQQQAAIEARGRAYGHASSADIEQIRAAREEQRGRSADYRNMRERQQVNGGGFVQPDRDVPHVMRSHNRTPVVSNVPRQGTQPPLRADSHRGTHNNWSSNWNRNWRNDNRYNWHNYRNQHRSRFHLSLYYDPFGWGYQPYSVGWRLWPNYYSSNYWINDPWQYRLPYAAPGTQWVRYYNDALLVDMYTGQVVDVLYNFFW